MLSRDDIERAFLVPRAMARVDPSDEPPDAVLARIAAERASAVPRKTSRGGAHEPTSSSRPARPSRRASVRVKG